MQIPSLFDWLFREKWIQRYVFFLQRWSGGMLLFSLLLTIGSIFLVLRIDVLSNLIVLLPEKTQSVRNLETVLEKTGGFGNLMVMVESPDFQQSLKYISDVSKEIEKLPWVAYTQYRNDVELFKKNKLLYMEYTDLKAIKSRIDVRVAYEKLHRNPFFSAYAEGSPPKLDFSDIETKYENKREMMEYFQSEDGKILILIIFPTGVTSNISFARRIYGETVDVVSKTDPKQYDSHMKVSVGGTFKNRLDEFDTVMRDVKSSAFWAGLGIFLLISFYFRNIISFFLICFPLCMGIAWTFGVTYLAIGNLNLITVFLCIILFGLGIDSGIHMLSRYFEERQNGNDVPGSLTVVLSKTGRAAFTAALTTMAAFYVLTITDFKGFSELGFIAGTGILFSLVAFFTTFPAVLILTEKMGVLRSFGKSNHIQKGLLHRYTIGTLVMSCIITVAALAYLPKLEFEYDLRKLRSDPEASREFKEKMKKVFTEPQDAALVLVNTIEEAGEVQDTVTKKIDFEDNGIIKSVKSLLSLLPSDQNEKLALAAELKSKLDSNMVKYLPKENHDKIQDLREHLDVSAVTVDDLPDSFVRPFKGLPGTLGQLVYVFQSRSLLDLRNAVKFSNEIKEIVTPNNTYYAASEPLVYADMLLMLRHDSKVALFLTFFIIFIFLFIDRRSLKSTILLLSPLILGIGWLLGIMGVFGLRFNLFNMLVLPIVIGIGIDNSVHIFYRYIEEGSHSLSVILRETGGALVITTGTSMIGFGSMLSAEHPGLHSIGLLAVIGLGMCLITSLMVFPAILNWLDRRRSLHPSSASEEY